MNNFYDNFNHQNDAKDETKQDTNDQQEIKMDDNMQQKNKKNKKRGLHTTTTQIDAIYNNTPYKKEKLAIPDGKSQVNIAIREYEEWDRFFEPKSLPNIGDWLEAFPEEKSGQTFSSWYRYIKKTKIWAMLSNPNKNSIGLITCGSFNIYLTQQLYPLFDILSEITQVYYFGINIEILKSMSSRNITSRHNSSSNNKQLQTTSIEYQLKNIKRNHMHRNLCCLMGISIIDLYPDDSWNFVFGQASINDMVGIFSFARYFPGFYQLVQLKRIRQKEQANKLKNLKAMIDGDITTDDRQWLNKILNKKEQILFIRRCLGVLLHEIGHLFGLEHCVYFQCCMNGANHLIESDAAPLYLCPVCLHKLYFAKLMMEKAQNKSAKRQKRKKNKNSDDNNIEQTKYLDILTRYQQLSVLYSKYGLTQESKWYTSRSQFILSSIVSSKKKD